MRIELHDVGKRFGAVAALQGIDLELPAGSRTALIGPNGSGKSTLVRVLMGMLSHSGKALLDGTPSADRSALAQRVAYVPQIAPRLCAPVREVVAAIQRLRGIAPAALAEIAAALDLDLDTLGPRPFRALSGGQRQKVLAALALASRADLLLLDEPTASMDSRSRSVFLDLVEQLPDTATVLLCSHRLDEIRRLVTSVAVLEEGRLAWHGPADEYLGAHADAVVEVRAAGTRAGDWLLANGFEQGSSGWWRRGVAAGHRAALVRDVVQNLNGTLGDVVARDVERLQPDARRGEQP
jgi:ABC-type multidrug transport system ATPase subunit